LVCALCVCLCDLDAHAALRRASGEALDASDALDAAEAAADAADGSNVYVPEEQRAALVDAADAADVAASAAAAHFMARACTRMR
jgi:hypothetical protein